MCVLTTCLYGSLCLCVSHAFGWPNEVHSLPPGAVKGSSDEAMLVADGFLMPGRSDGGLYIVQEPGKATEKVTRITRNRTGWFYHKAVWVHEMMGANSRPCVLTARATKPFFGQSAVRRERRSHAGQCLVPPAGVAPC